MRRLNPWLYIPKPRPSATKRLLVFHHAGASSAAYFPWIPILPASIEVVFAELAGRGSRSRDAPLTEMEEVISEFQRALEDCTDKPFSFFGHSLGGVVAYLLALEAERCGKRLPEHLFISSAQPSWSERRIECFDRPALINYMQKLGGTPLIVFDTEELLNLTLKLLRHDLKLLECPSPEMKPVNCPIHAFVGDSDLSVSVRNTEQWRYWTAKYFEVRVFTGGHFYLNEHRDELIREISTKMF